MVEKQTDDIKVEINRIVQSKSDKYSTVNGDIGFLSGFRNENINACGL